MTTDLRAGIEALRSDLGEWSDAIAGGVAYPTPAEQSASATLENVIAQLDVRLAAHPVQDEAEAFRAAFQEGYNFALTYLDDEPVQADLARLRPDHPVQVTTGKAEAWEEGWEAGCNDQQYGNEDAEPWTSNPYRADRINPTDRPEVTP